MRDFKTYCDYCREPIKEAPLHVSAWRALFLRHESIEADFHDDKCFAAWAAEGIESRLEKRTGIRA